MKLISIMAGLVASTSVLTFGVLYWLDKQADPVIPAQLPAEDSMQARVELVNSKGCTACHSLDGQEGVGPGWVGVWGMPVEFTDGTSGIFDEAYFYESVVNPGAKVLKGFQNVMIPAPLSEVEQEQVLLLIKELGKPNIY